MIERNVLYNIDYYKTTNYNRQLLPYYGSYQGMRFKIEYIKGNEEENTPTILRAWVFPEPLGFDATDDSLKESKDFEASNAGLDDVCDWLNESYENKKDYYLSKI